VIQDHQTPTSKFTIDRPALSRSILTALESVILAPVENPSTHLVRIPSKLVNIKCKFVGSDIAEKYLTNTRSVTDHIGLTRMNMMQSRFGDFLPKSHQSLQLQCYSFGVMFEIFENFVDLLQSAE
jgi:hypothetical protein